MHGLALNAAAAACVATLGAHHAGADDGAWTRADDVRAIVADMMADAEGRASLSDSAGGAGHDGSGFFIRSDDGGAELRLRGLIQFRYQYTRRGDRSDESGFFAPRPRIWAQGRIREGIRFYVRGQFSRRSVSPREGEGVVGGVFFVDRAWADLRLAEGWTLRIGKQITDFSRENQRPPQHQLTVDQSPTSRVFGLGVYQGARLTYRGDELRTHLIVSDGARDPGRDYDDPAKADIAVTLKGEWKLAGEWSRFRTFTSFPGSDFGLLLGAGFHWETGATLGEPEEDRSLVAGVGEVSLEGDGWTLHGALHVAHGRRRANAADERTDFGLLVQGSFFVGDRFEPYARFDAIFADPDREDRSGDFRTLTIGANYYVFPGSTDLKFSVDVMYMFDAQSESIMPQSRNAGVLASDDSGQVTVRAQLTFLF